MAPSQKLEPNESILDRVGSLSSEVNSLLDHSDQLIERSRTRSGNLAHALKNPLTVIRNEATQGQGESGRVLSKLD